MTINEFNKNYKKLRKTEVRLFLQENAGVDLPVSVLGRVFEKFYVKEDGTSDFIDLQNLITLHHSFSLGNGGGWCRADDSSFLGRKYIVENFKESGRITQIKVSGYKTQEHRKKYKKVSTKVIEELADIADSYKGLKGALEVSPNLDEEIRRGVVNEIDRLEMKMLFLVDEITKR